MAQEPQGREPRRFEPPPWEREQFEELERKLAERERAAAQELESETAQGDIPEPAQPQEAEPEPPGEAAPKADAQRGAPIADRPAASSEIETMFLALKAEEGRSGGGIWKLGIAAGVFVGTIGVMLVIWGTVAMARSQGHGPVGTMGAMIMSLMGGLFIGLAAWMGLRSLRQRGVL